MIFRHSDTSLLCNPVQRASVNQTQTVLKRFYKIHSAPVNRRCREMQNYLPTIPPMLPPDSAQRLQNKHRQYMLRKIVKDTLLPRTFYQAKMYWHCGGLLNPTGLFLFLPRFLWKTATGKQRLKETSVTNQRPRQKTTALYGQKVTGETLQVISNKIGQRSNSDVSAERESKAQISLQIDLSYREWIQIEEFDYRVIRCKCGI